MLNEITVIGRVVGEVKRSKIKTEKKQTLNITTIYVAVARENGKKQFDVIKCNALGSMALNVALNARKGRLLCVKGRLTVDQRKAYGNVPSLDIYVTITTVYFLDEDNPTLSYLKAKEEQKKAVKKATKQTDVEPPKVEKKAETDDDILRDLDEDAIFDF